MTVKEVIQSSAELLDIELTAKNIELFVECYNLVENELALEYFPLRTVDKVLIKDNKIKYDELERKAWQIMGVHNCDSHELKYKLCQKHIGFAKKENGKYCWVRYCYVPQEKTVDGISVFDEGMFKDILKYGVCAEYCLINADWEQAKLWSDKYKKSINLFWFKWKTKELQNG